MRWAKILILNDKPQDCDRRDASKIRLVDQRRRLALPLSINFQRDPGVATIVRLGPGVSKDAAQQQMDTVPTSRLQLAKEYPANFPKERLHNRPEELFGNGLWLKAI